MIRAAPQAGSVFPRHDPSVKITPRYDGPPVIRLDGDPTADAEPLARERRRLEATLAGFSDDEWREPSRCDGWSVQDAVTHVVSMNAFWAFPS